MVILKRKINAAMFDWGVSELSSELFNEIISSSCSRFYLIINEKGYRLIPRDHTSKESADEAYKEINSFSKKGESFFCGKYFVDRNTNTFMLIDFPSITRLDFGVIKDEKYA